MPASSRSGLVPAITVHCPILAARLAAYERARRSWATIELSFEQFATHLERLGWHDALPGHLDAIYITAACSVGVEAACVTLERRYFSALKQALAQHRESWHFVDEVLQCTRERLFVGPCPRIATYRGDGPLATWLLVVARRLAQDIHRGDNKHRRIMRLELQHHERAFVEPDALRARASYRMSDAAWIEQLERAVLRAIAALDSDDRRLLYGHYVENRKAAEMGLAFGIDRATVYRRLRRVEGSVARLARRELRESLRSLDADALDELLRESYSAINLDTRWAFPENARALDRGRPEGVASLDGELRG